MSLFPTNKIERVVLKAYQDVTCNSAIPGDNEITLPLVESGNGVEMDYSINWGNGASGGSDVGNMSTGSNPTAVGSPLPQQEFAGYGSTELNLSVVVDATGVLNVPGTDGKGLDKIKYDSPDISEYIKLLKKVVFDFYGSGHRPPFVSVTWGKVLGSSSTITDTSSVYKGKLKSMKIKYVLFSSEGNPVRAEIDLSFIPAVDPAKPTGTSSPDLTHIIEVKYGDNLPAMCKKIYSDPSYYLQVAKINNLASAFALEPGMKLIFPPLEKSSR